MPETLLLIGLGPVQEFIERARRTRDVWFGSWILSDLSHTVAHSLSKQDCTLIFPHPKIVEAPPDPQQPASAVKIKAPPDPQQPASIANQILASTQLDPATVITQAHTAFMGKLETFRDEALEGFRSSTPPYVKLDSANQDRAWAQIEDLFEFQWAWVPLLDSYPTQRRALYNLFNARKHTRSFGPIPWQPTVAPDRRSDKSSLDGWREKVATGEKQGENLSGVDLLKRYAQRREDNSSFPSTSHMAALPFGKHLLRHDSNIQAGWTRYIERLTECDPRFTKNEQVARRFRQHSIFGRFDGSLIYESRLGEDIRPASNDEGDKKEHAKLIAAGRNHLKDFFTSQSDLPSIPPGYYAIMAADGDHMGELISKLDKLTDHQAISEKVAEFAQDAAKLIESTDHQGAVIFAGGDDVLALLPLHTMLDCAKAIAELFAERLSELVVPGAKAPTLSVGIAIVHHLDALQAALELARKAEKTAKIQRNSLAITLSKRNGADTTIVGQWSSPLVDELKWLIFSHQHAQLPDGLIFELRDMLKRFDLDKAQSADERKIWLKIITCEVERILKRKHTSDGKQVTPATLAAIMLLLTPPDPTQAAQTLEHAIKLNIVARELAASNRMVHGDAADPKRAAELQLLKNLYEAHGRDLVQASADDAKEPAR